MSDLEPSGLTFTNPELTAINGESTPAIMTLLQLELNGNTISVASNRGGGQFGHLALTLSDANYAMHRSLSRQRQGRTGQRRIIGTAAVAAGVLAILFLLLPLEMVSPVVAAFVPPYQHCRHTQRLYPNNIQPVNHQTNILQALPSFVTNALSQLSNSASLPPLLVPDNLLHLLSRLLVCHHSSHSAATTHCCSSDTCFICCTPAAAALQETTTGEPKDATIHSHRHFFGITLATR
jgi:hypothetical protein